MDTDATPTIPVMPRSTPLEAIRPTAAAETHVSVSEMDRGDRNNVFGHLVKDDADIAGLVAYSIYKQNKLDWLRAFEAARGRVPDENELASYIIGEGTPRRLATYRHLAEATLAGNGPEVDGAPVSSTRVPSTRRFARTGESYAAGTIALYALIAVLFVLGLYLALHFTASSR